MILKGNARSGAKNLADHLTNATSNERVELAEVRGFVADDLDGAFREAEAIASGTNCAKFLYSLSINPSQPITRDQYRHAIEQIEAKLGLDDQPRAIVFHEKEGREHAHVVWSRIDGDTMKARPLPFDRQKLREMSRELATTFEHTLPEGLASDRGTERFKEQFKDVTLAENGQQDRSEITPADRKAEITAAYQQSDSAGSFRAALAERGYTLAKGDKADRKGNAVPVVIDKAGEVYGLRRQIEGVRAKELRNFLSLELPSVQQAKTANAIERRQKSTDGDLKPVEGLSPDERAQHYQARLDALSDAQRAELKALKGRFADELKAISLKENDRIEAAKAGIRDAYKPEWRAMFKEQRAELEAFKRQTSTIASRFQAFATGRAGQFYENSGSLAGTFQFVMKGQTDIAKLEKRHSSERRGLGDMQRLAEREELRAIKSEGAQARKDTHEQQKDTLDTLKKLHAQERHIFERESGKAQGKGQGTQQTRPKSVNETFTENSRSDAMERAKERYNLAVKRDHERRNSKDLGRTR